MIKRTLTMVALMSTALLLTACGDNKDEKKAPEVAKAKTELNYASMKDIRNINPHLYLGEMAAQAMVFEPLVMNTPDGTVKPWLAQSWDISDDGRVYTFHLRPGVKFSDGAPFDAEAVKKNIDAVMANKSRHAWMDLFRVLDKVEVVDSTTVKLYLKQPYYPTLVELGLTRPMRFISPNCMKDGGTKDGVSCLVGTGPWVLAEHKDNQYSVFKVNPTYWGTKPKIQSVRWMVMPDAQTMLLSLKKGEIDLIFGADGDQLSSDAFTQLQKEGKFATVQSRPIASRAILLNTAQPVTGDAMVREAIQHAINRQAIVDGVLNGAETPAPTLFAKNVPGADIPLTPREYDPKLSDKLLDEAGWKMGNDGVRVKDGKRCEVNFYFNSKNAQEKTIAEAIQADLAKVGIAVNVIGEEKQAFLDRQRTGKFDMQYSLSWGAPYDPQSYFASWRFPSHGDYQAQVGMKDKQLIDDEITLLMVEPNEEKRKELVKDILTRVHNAGVYFPVSYSRTKAVHSTKLKNVQFAVTQYEIPFELMEFEPATPAK